jgi:hypothetical protein
VVTNKIILILWTCSSLVLAQANDSIHPTSAQDTPSAHLGVLCIDKLPGPDAWAERGKGSATPEAYKRPDPFILESTGKAGGMREASPQRSAAALKERPVYFVSVDGGEWKEFTQSKGNCVPDLSIEQRHTIQVVDAQKQPVASFRFRFEPGVTAKHVYYYSFYNSWIVDIVPKRRLEKILGSANAGISCAVCR